jgi:hypothetical protein
MGYQWHSLPDLPQHPAGNWLPSSSSLPLAGGAYRGGAGCEDLFNSLLDERKLTRGANTAALRATGQP